MSPHVSFVVPCYKLAHLLPECIHSILSQTYGDFEIIIMDDCSPDNTPEVARSFGDPRVMHVRNETNLRHLANYNKGVELARGKYVWLISADDRLRKTYVLEKYVSLLDEHPEVGYAFCPAINLENGAETELLQYSSHGDQDTIFKGASFLNRLLEFNCVVAASALARKECYEKISLFPLDMPYAGDWYLWCVFAMHYDVAYFAEPMVNYRQHTQSMTNILKNEDIDILFNDDLSVLTRIRDNARLENKNAIVLKCNMFLINRCMKRFESHDINRIEDLVKECKEIFQNGHLGNYEWHALAVRIYTGLADRYYEAGKVAEAKKYYKDALFIDWRLWKAWLKYILLFFGKTGSGVRALISHLKYQFSHI